jgi:hypothetical protein
MPYTAPAYSQIAKISRVVNYYEDYFWTGSVAGALGKRGSFRSMPLRSATSFEEISIKPNIVCRDHPANTVATLWSGKESCPKPLTGTKITVEVKSIVADSRTDRSFGGPD